MWPELNQMPLNNHYSAVINLHPYQFSLLAARVLGSKFLPPQGNGLYCSYMGDSDSRPRFHSVHLIGHPAQTFARFCDSRISSLNALIQFFDILESWSTLLYFLNSLHPGWHPNHRTLNFELVCVQSLLFLCQEPITTTPVIAKGPKLLARETQSRGRIKAQEGKNKRPSFLVSTSQSLIVT